MLILNVNNNYYYPFFIKIANILGWGQVSGSDTLWGGGVGTPTLERTEVFLRNLMKIADNLSSYLLYITCSSFIVVGAYVI